MADVAASQCGNRFAWILFLVLILLFMGDGFFGCV